MTGRAGLDAKWAGARDRGPPPAPRGSLASPRSPGHTWLTCVSAPGVPVRVFTPECALFIMEDPRARVSSSPFPPVSSHEFCWPHESLPHIRVLGPRGDTHVVCSRVDVRPRLAGSVEQLPAQPAEREEAASWGSFSSRLCSIFMMKRKFPCSRATSSMVLEGVPAG